VQAPGASGPSDPWAPPDPAPVPAPVPAPPPAPAWEQQPWGQQPWGQQPWGQQPWGAAPWGAPPPPPDPRGRRRAVVAIGSVVVLLLALLAGSAVLEERRADRVRAEVTALLPELRAFVEQERGLPFLDDVEVEVLDDGAFLEALYAESPDAPEPREDRDSERTLVALGLLDADVDLDEAVTDSLDEGVVGFYDPSTGALAVRGREVDAFVRLVLVHELTHALQDQHFDIDRPELDEADDERGLAFRSLVEGDAVRVETAWLLEQPPAVQRELAQLFDDGGPSQAEPVVEAVLGFPYRAGPGLAQALLDSGGQPALDAAFRDPPTTAEQVLDPDAGTGVEVRRPEPAGAVVDEGVLGVLALALLLGGDPLVAGPERGWNGDRYVTAEQDGRTCTRAHLAVDDPDSGAALTAALQGWAAGRPEATVGPGPDGVVALEACSVS
jgi:hypothetical protein